MTLRPAILCLLSLLISAPVFAADDKILSSDRLEQRDPSPQDDANAGYTVGDLWINHKDHKAWKIADNAAGAARWEPLPWPTKPVADAVTSAPCMLGVGTKPLKSGYTGNLITLVRASDKSENSFGAVDGNVNTTGVSDFLKKEPGAVTALYDQCGAHNLTAFSDHNRAGYSFDRASKTAAIVFNGLNHMGDQTNAPLLQNVAGPVTRANDFSVFIVGEVAGAALNAVMVDFDTTNHALLMGSQAGTRTYIRPEPKGGTNFGAAFESVPSVIGLTSGKAVKTFSNMRVQNMGGTYPATNMPGLHLGGTDAVMNYPGSMDLMAFMVFGGELSPADVESLNLAAAAQFGLIPQARTKLIGIGDSIMAGYGAGESWLKFLYQKLPGTAGLYNFAVPGIRARDWLKTVDHISSVFARGEKYLIIIDLGANDMKLGEARRPDAVYGDVTTLMKKLREAVRRAGAKAKIGVATILPNNMTTGELDDNRLTYNHQVMENAAGFDFTVDFAAERNLNAANAIQDRNLYVDGSHPGTAAQRFMADHAAKTMLGQ